MAKSEQVMFRASIKTKILLETLAKKYKISQGELIENLLEHDVEKESFKKRIQEKAEKEKSIKKLISKLNKIL